MRSHQALSVCLLFSLMAVSLLGWPIAQAAAAEKPSIWVVLEPKKFGYSAEELFSRLDENKDGRIDESELRLHKMALFGERDVDRSDALDRKELGQISERVFKDIDTNGDGKISGYEFNQSTRIKLSTMDANKDGKVSLEELRAYLAAIRNE